MSRIVMFVLLGLVIPFAACAEDMNYREGRHYVRINQAQSAPAGDVEVLEFFRYGCGHCRNFEPFIHKWKENLPAGVKFKQLPAVMNASSAVQAKAFFAAHELGVADTVHPALFAALHDKRLPINTEDQIADVVKDLGLDVTQFLDSMRSFKVDALVRNAMQTIRRYRVPGVPAVIVNGRYMTSGGMARSFAEMIKVIDYLVEQEKKANKT